MIPLRPLLALLALQAPATHGQEIAAKGPERDAALTKTIDALAAGDARPSAAVDLDKSAPSLVGDDFSAHSTPAKESPEAAQPPTPDAEAPTSPPEGVTVQVEAGAKGPAEIDAKGIKLLAPFPAKTLFQAPAGWRLEHPAKVPTIVRPVDLANGTRISLAIRPHLLVPDADGENVIAIDEPGYDPALSHAQTGTIGAVLSSSVESMEAESRKMSDALDRLSQLLGSLPTPEPQPAPTPSPAKKSR